MRRAVARARRRRRRRAKATRRMPFSRHQRSASASTKTPPWPATSATPTLTLPRADPGLRQIDQVVVDEEGSSANSRFQLLARRGLVAASADAEQQHVGGAEDQADAPDELGPVERRRLAQQLCRRQRPRRLAPAPSSARSPACAGRSRSARASSRRCSRSARCAGPCSGSGSGSSPSICDRARLRAEVTDSTSPCDATMRTLRPLAGSLAPPSKKNVRRPSAELWNWPGAMRDRSERRSNWSFSSALRSFCHGQTKARAGRRRAAPASSSQHRPDEAPQRDAAREPDRHLAAAVHARQRRDDGDEERQGEQGRQVAEADVAEQQQDVLRRDPAEGGLAEVPDEHDRQHDRQEHDQRPPKLRASSRRNVESNNIVGSLFRRGIMDFRHQIAAPSGLADLERRRARSRRRRSRRTPRSPRPARADRDAVSEGDLTLKKGKLLYLHRPAGVAPSAWSSSSSPATTRRNRSRRRSRRLRRAEDAAAQAASGSPPAPAAAWAKRGRGERRRRRRRRLSLHATPSRARRRAWTPKSVTLCAGKRTRRRCSAACAAAKRSPPA